MVSLLLAITFTINAQLYTYPEGLRTGIPHNDDFTVRVRTKGGGMEGNIRV